MAATPKEILYSQEARNKLASGIGQLTEAVRYTLGPKGRNAGIEKSWGAPMITNDGNSIVKEVSLKDPFENMGASMAKEVASKLKEKCGDGTTTGTLLLHALVQMGVKYIAAGVSPIHLKRGVEKAVDAVVKELESQAMPIKNVSETKSIATASASGNEEIGAFISEALEKAGKGGVVTIEEAKGTETYIEVVEGMQFDRGYVSSYFCTQSEKQLVEMHDPLILLTDKKISSIQEIIGILQVVASSAKELLIVCEEIEADALATLVVNKMRGTLKVAAVKAPGFGDRRKAMLEDIAVLTGGKVITEEAGLHLKEVTVEMLGHAERVLIKKENTTIIGGKGSPEAIRGRVAQIDLELANTKTAYDKEKLEERKAKLGGGVAVIRVGGMSKPEVDQKKQMFEDSLQSTKASLEEGVVLGGGTALFRAAQVVEKLALDREEAVGAQLVLRACEAPLRQIAANTGYDGSVVLSEIRAGTATSGFNARTERVEDLLTAGVLDPAKVVKSTLLYAASVATIVLISEALISEVTEETEA